MELISVIEKMILSLDWMVLAVSGYFLMSVVFVFDKYLLHSRISKPSVYAFYVAAFSLFAIAFIPFGFYFPGTKIFILATISGFFFVYGLVSLYRAVQENEISRVAPLVGTIVPIISVFYAIFFLGERLNPLSLSAILILISGGFLVSFDLPIHNLKLFGGFRYSALAAFLHVTSFGMLKEVFENAGFINGFIWNRIGFFLAGMSLLLFPIFRKQIVSSFNSAKKSKKEATSTSMFFVANKVMAGVGSFLIVFAISKGSVSSVTSLGSIQFAFILGLLAILSIRYKHIFQEKLSFSDWMQKVFAILLIGLGIWMLSLSDGKTLYLVS